MRTKSLLLLIIAVFTTGIIAFNSANTVVYASGNWEHSSGGECSGGECTGSRKCYKHDCSGGKCEGDQKCYKHSCSGGECSATNTCSKHDCSGGICNGYYQKCKKHACSGGQCYGDKKCDKHKVKPWLTLGNDNIDDTEHFLGTINEADLVIKTHEVEKMRVTATGDVGIGTASPAGTLHVNGGSADGVTNGKDILLDAQDGGPDGGAGGNIILIPGLSGDDIAPGGNVGIYTDTPTQTLDINGQVRIRGGLPASGKVLTSLDAAGNAAWETVDVNDEDSDPTNEFNTSAVLTGTSLDITDAGGTFSVDLSSLQSAGTDDQNLTGASLSGTILQVTIEDGASASVDLAPIDTDDQNLTGASLTGTILQIDIENGASASVDLAPIDDQTLSISGTTLSIADGNSVDLTDLAGFGDNLGNHIAEQNIQLTGYFLSGDGGNEGIFVDTIGNVGVGTAVPGAKLHIAGGNIRFNDLQNPLMEIGSLPIMWTDASPGVLKIGSPGSINNQVLALQVGGPSTSGNEFFAWDANANKKFIQYKTDDGRLVLQPASGSVGIGLTPLTEKLEIAGNLKFDMGRMIYWDWVDRKIEQTGTRIRFMNSGVAAGDLSNPDGGFDFANTDGTSYLRILQGNIFMRNKVGINTTTPFTSLQVNGGIRARGGSPGFDGVGDNGYAFEGNGGDRDSGMFSSAIDQVEFYVKDQEVVRINPNSVHIRETAEPGVTTLTIDGMFSIIEAGGTLASNHTIFQGGAQTGDITYTLPGAQGGTDTVLTNDGLGNLSWGTVDTGSLWSQTLGNDIYYNTGKVGIGLTNPGTIFHVKGQTSNDAVLFIEPGTWAGTGDYGEIRFGDLQHYIRTEHTEGTIFHDVNRFKFIGGNVGIGATNPGQKLTVDGSIGILEVGSTPTFHTILQGGDQTGDITYTFPVAQGGSGAVLTNNGIGLLSWEIPAGSEFSNGGEDGGPGRTLGNTNIASLGFLTGNLTRLRIQGNGDIGIGLENPITKLHVKGQTPTDAVVLIEPGEWNSTGDYGEIRFGDTGHFIRGEWGNGMTFNDNDTLQFKRNGVEIMRIHSNNSVGIGTSNPQAQLHTTGSVRFAGFGAGTLQTDASGNLSVSSDIRLKNIEGDFKRGLSAILEIDPVNYTWKQETGLDTINTYSGFSAQNVKNVIPEAVSQDKRGYLTLSDRPIIAALVNAVKELKAENDNTGNQNSALKNENKQLKERLLALETRQNAIEDMLLALSTDLPNERLAKRDTEQEMLK